jgi:hypothetical protein
VFQVPLEGRTEDELLKGFNQLWRRNIKKAEKLGVTVRQGAADDLAAFHALYLETAERDHFTGRPLSYFQRMWEAMRAEDPDRIRLYLAEHEGDLVAATTMVRVGQHAWYSYGASSTAKREVRGSNAVQWAMLRDAAAAGAPSTTCAASPTRSAEDDPHFGLIQFKLGTGGEAVEYVGEWDLPLNKVLFKASSSTWPGAGEPAMTFTLYVDEARWRAHLAATVAATPDIVPVIKGNGYGLGNARLAAEAARLGVRHRRGRHRRRAARGAGRLPRRRAGADPVLPAAVRRPDRRVVQTVAHVESVRAAGAARVVVEADDVDAPPRARRRRPAGRWPGLAGLTAGRLAFHLPMDRHGGYDPAAEVADWLRRLAAAGVPTSVAFVSHLTAADLAGLRRDFPARRSGRGSAPRSGWATAARCRRAAPCSTCTGSRAAPTTATGGGGRRGTATSWWSAAGPRTAWLWRHRARSAGRWAAARRSPSARSRRPTCRCRRSGGPASSVGSPSRRTCTCPAAAARLRRAPRRSAPSSTATSASPPCTPTTSAP